MLFIQEYKKLLKEYSSDSNEMDRIVNTLSTKYRSRRIILTNNEFSPKTYFTQHYPNRPESSLIRPKPRGTWYARGEDWANWMRSESPDWFESYNHAYWLDLNYSKILRINTKEKFLDFEKTYLEQDNSYYSRPMINWARVTKDYHGIEIIPYFWQFRNKDWYYPWDIASGCIWNSDAIKQYVEIPLSENSPEI